MVKEKKYSPLLKNLKVSKDNAPRKSETLLDTLVDQKDESDTEASPEDYNSKLKAVGLTKETATVIMEAILFEGVYVKEYTLLNRIKVMVGTRSYKDIQRATRLLEAENPQTAAHVNDLIARFNVAASLRSFGDKQFKHPDASEGEEKVDDAFFERLDFIMNKPALVVDALIRIVNQFDTMTRVIFTEDAVQNF